MVFLVGRHTDSTGKCWGMSMEIWAISCYIHEGIDIGRILRSPQRGKGRFWRPNNFVPQSSEVVKASGAPSSIQISLGTCQRLAITMTTDDSIYMHFQDFSPEFARTPTLWSKGLAQKPLQTFLMNADVIMIFHRLYLDWGRLTNHAVHGCLDIAKRYATCSFKPYGQEYGGPQQCKRWRTW